ncbi:hypothetical protein FG386_003615 [Cryptosporidium ryanae]|uniref:uncharacterized protein n=1 Tax=Cryptosporidium ryanae TaxID=515981 RepID=UPI00351A1241|nr:hypothetical protein FG386_003615 [Cryptosporidium ryanae]
MKKVGFSVIILAIIGMLVPVFSEVIPSFIPVNNDIPDKELSRLSLKVLPILANKYNIQIYSDRIRLDSRTKCQRIQDFDDKYTIKGCEIGVYVCDTEFHKQCLWIHKSHCQCSTNSKLNLDKEQFTYYCVSGDFWRLKECRITITRVPTGDSEYPHINVPIGECKLAIWIFVLLSLIGTVLLGFAIRIIANSFYKVH